MDNKKIKSNSGSVLALAIICIALFSILVPTISFQINNQIKLNNKIYDDMKYKYAAEAGFEKAIYDIEADIRNKIPYRKTIRSKNHDNCPKVEFINGRPVIGHYAIPGDTFAYLIYNEMILYGMNNVMNGTFGSELETVLGTNHPLIGNDRFLWKEYQEKILGYISSVSMTPGFEYDSKVMERNLNDFISMLNTLSEDVKKSQSGSDAQRKKLIGNIDSMREYLIEIKCRLNLGIVEDDEYKDILIDIPTYIVSLRKDEDLIFNKNVNQVMVKVKRNLNGEVQDIDLKNINSIISKSANKIIQSKIEFTFNKIDNDYDIGQNIKEYKYSEGND